MNTIPSPNPETPLSETPSMVPVSEQESVQEPKEPLRPVSWRIVYHDDEQLSSDGHTWDEQASFQTIDEVSLQVSIKPIKLLEVLVHNETFRLVPPLPLPMFALTRIGVPLNTGETRWLYTLFGYVLGAEGQGLRILLTLTPDGVFSHLFFRSDPFTL